MKKFSHFSDMVFRRRLLRTSFLGVILMSVSLFIYAQPTAIDDEVSTDEDVQLTGSVATNDITGVGTNVWNLVSGVSHGSLTFNSDGSYTYTPALNTYGSDSFTYELCDEILACDQAVVTITINPLADTPTVTNAATNEDTQTTSGLVIYRNAQDGPEVTHYKISNIQYGVLYQLDGTTIIPNNIFITAAQGMAGLRFTPSLNGTFNGSFNIQSSLSASDAGIDPMSGIATATITVTPVNDMPSFVGGGNQSINEDFGPQTIIGWATSITDGDPEASQVLGFNVSNDNTDLFTAQPSISTDGTLTFTSAPDAYGNATVTVTLTDDDLAGGLALTTTGQTFTITINPLADTPTVTNAATNEDTQTTSGLVIYRNAQDGPEVTHYKISNIQYGVLYQLDGTTIIPNNIFITAAQGTAGLRFTPSLNGTFNGSFNIQSSLSASDAGIDPMSGIATATITVTAVNDAPVVTDIPDQSFPEGSVFSSITLDDYVSDIDNTDAEMAWSYSGNTDLTVSIDLNRVATITLPDLEWNGSEAITFRATDPGGSWSEDLATFTITAEADAPVVTDIPDQSFPEGSVFSSISLDDYVSDIDNTDAEMAWSYSGNTDLTVSIDLNRVATITLPDLEWNGSEAITFRATDPGGSWSEDLATFTITAEADAPVVTDIPDQSFPEGSVFSSISLDDYVSDIDNTDAEMAWSYSGNTDLTVSIDLNRVATITLPDLEWNGSEAITFRATDPGGSWSEDLATFTITAEADAPVVTDIPDQSFPEGSVFSSITLDDYVSDIDNTDAEMAWSYSGNTDLTVSIDLNRVATITLPDLEWNGSEAITFRATDPGGSWSEDLATFTITAEADAPVVTDIPDQSFPEGSVFSSISLDDYVSDIDNTDAEMAWSYSGNTDLTVSIDLNRVATITLPDLEWNGSEAITFRATDPGGSWSEDLATFTITAEADAPVVTDIPDQSFPEGSVFSSISLDDYVSDIDNTDAEMAWSYSGNTDLTVSIDLNRVATISAPSADWNGSETITFTATDPGFLSDSDDAVFTVTAVIDLPPGWEVNPPDFNHSGQVTAKVYFNGSPLESGFLAAFVGEECRGIVDTSYFPPSDHFVYSLMFYSNNAVGDTLIFKYYDPVEDKIYKLDTSFVFVPDMIIGNAITPKLMYEGIDYNNSFKLGWNWFSVNARYDNMSLNTVLSSCAMQDDYIKSQDSTATYYSGFGWWGSLDKLSPRDLYKVRVANPCGIKFLGRPVDISTEVVNIVTGWNWIGYYPQSSLPISDALASLTMTQLDNIKSQEEVSTYYDGYGWFGDLDSLKSTEGYMIKVTLPGTLAYPEIPELKSAIVYQEEDKTGFCPDRFEFSGTMTAKVVIDGEQDRDEGNLLLAIVKDEIRGVVESHYFAPLDVWLYPLMIHSNLAEGEIVQFRFYDNKNDKFYSCEETLTFKNDMIVADAFKAFELNVKSGTGINEPESTDGFELKSYPNPFDMALNIEYQIKVQAHISLTIYDISGRIIDIPVDQLQDPDRYIIRWDLSLQPAGTYIIKLNADEKQIIRKVSLVR